MPLRLLVTGGTGLLGGAVLEATTAHADLTPLATFHHARGERAGVEWFPLDLRQLGTQEAIARARPDVVLHAAAAIAPGDLCR
jgi:nucleoside-diphosphate-sugar epimerase